MINSSTPPAFETRMRTQLGPEYDLLKQSLILPAPVSIRINPAKYHGHLKGKKIPWARHGIYLNERPSFTLDPLFHAGAYYVQEASSMFLDHIIDQVFDQHKPILALDLCAAPGGKSTHLLSVLPPDSLLVSNEVIRSRASILSENVQKWGYPNVVVTNNDPHHFHDLEGVFDLMVVDAPCSGEGLFRKDPEAMRQWSDANVQLCAQRQQRIISDVWPALKEGGILIYSTCTYSRQENEENLKWLGENFGAEFISIPVTPEWGVRKVNEQGVIGYRFYPHQVEGEGFFISAVRKTSTTHKSIFKSKKAFTFLPEKKNAIFLDWFMEPAKAALILQDDLVILLPQQWITEIQWLSQHLTIVTKGTAVATMKHDKAIPDHALALSIGLNRSHFTTHQLSKEDALHYLRKDNLQITATEKGFHLVAYDELPIGWINHLGHRINNLYPVAWRIKMSN